MTIVRYVLISIAVSRTYYLKASENFAFLRFIDMSPSEAHVIHLSSLIRRRLLATQENVKAVEDGPYYTSVTSLVNMYQISSGMVEMECLLHIRLSLGFD
jgi:hypothetical protein